MKITDVARQTNLSTETLRYYDRIGLVPCVKRDEDGIRYYDLHDVEWILLIKNLHEEGISLEMLLEFVTLEKESKSCKNIIIEEMCTCLMQHKDHIECLLECLRHKLKNSE